MCFVVTCWERADLLALVCGVFCEFVTFPLVSWVRCGTWLYRFLIFATLLTFPDAKRQLTPEFKVWSGRILNPSEILWLSSLPARMEKIQSKMKALEWSQHKQVALWATIAQLGASIMFGDTIIDDAQRQVALNLKQWPGTKKTRYYASQGYMQALFDLILYIPPTIFQLNRDGSSWVEPALS